MGISSFARGRSGLRCKLRLWNYPWQSIRNGFGCPRRAGRLLVRAANHLRMRAFLTTIRPARRLIGQEGAMLRPNVGKRHTNRPVVFKRTGDRLFHSAPRSRRGWLSVASRYALLATTIVRSGSGPRKAPAWRQTGRGNQVGRIRSSLVVETGRFRVIELSKPTIARRRGLLPDPG
jgi:hypothetical protein